MAAFTQLPKHSHPDFIGIRKKPGGGVQIDKNHPLSKGIRGAWLFNTPGAVRDIAGQIHAENIGGNATTKGTENGLVYTFDGANDYLDASANYSSINSAPNLFTMIARARRNGSGSTFQAIFTKGENGTDAGGLCGFWFHATNGIHWRAGSTVNAFDGSYTDGIFTTIALSYDFSDGLGKIYQDGVNLRTVGSTVNGGASKSLAFGGLCFNLTADDLNGDIEFAYLYDRRLSDAEIAAISKNPYQILKPAIENQAIIVSASAGTITGTAAHQATTATHTAAGTRAVTTAVSHQASTATHSATGERTITGASTHQAATATHAATGERTITGSASHQAATSTQSATGTRTITGSAAHQAATATQSASGSIDGAISGTAAHQANTAAHSATGLRIVGGTASHQAGTATHAATGERVITGASSHQSNTATHSASGATGNVTTGTASHQANTATQSASGLRLITGSATHQAADSTQSAAGLRVITGTGYHQAQRATHSASSPVSVSPLSAGTKSVSDISNSYEITNISNRYSIAG